MKDVIVIPRVQVHPFIGQLWRTQEFQDAHGEVGSYVHNMVAKLALYPRAFFVPTEDIEHGHFTTWMGFISLRQQYTNPYIHDLYLLHEISHLATMDYHSECADFNTWYLKMQENELFAALSSEVFIYFFMAKEGRPIRDKTFDHKIWADRFLFDDLSHYSGFDLENYKQYFNYIISARRTVMYGFGVNAPGNGGDIDWEEYQVSRFAAQNYQWATLWRNHYHYVEQGMSEMMQLTKGVTPYRQRTDEGVFEHYVQKYLEPHAEDGIYFRNLAAEFDEVFKRNNAQFGNLVDAAGV